MDAELYNYDDGYMKLNADVNAKSIDLEEYASKQKKSSAASAALGAISEDQSILGKSLIFVGLAEGVALYGLIISFMILGKL